MELPDLLEAHQGWLVQRVVGHARESGYALYAMTLEEAWAAAVGGTTAALVASWRRHPRPAPLTARQPEDEPAGAFAVEAARRHRARGAALPHLLGMLKHVRLAYLDLCDARLAPETGAAARRFLDAAFDRMEVAAAGEWAAAGEQGRIAELGQANRALALEKGKYLTLFHSMPQPVLLVEPDGVVGTRNPAAARLLHPAEPPGAAPRDDRPPEAAPAWLAPAIEPVLRGRRRRVEFEVALETVEGRRRFAARAERMLDVSEKFDAVVVLMEDVTERRRIEARLAVAERLASLGTLVAGVAHEVNNPLAGATADLGFLGEELERADAAAPALGLGEAREALDNARQATARVARIVKALQGLAERRGGAPEPVELWPPVERVLARLGGALRARARLEVSVPPGLQVHGQAAALERVLEQLLDNALRAVPAGEASRHLIRVEARRDEGAVLLSVSDSGVGIPEAVRPRVFDPFFTTRPPGEGLGLGLAICHSLVTACGGTITLEPGQPAGTVARLHLRADPV